MKAPTVLILGGFDKHSEFDELFADFTENIKSVVILGATAPKIAAAADKAGFCDYIMANGFKDAVIKAYKEAREGWNVLLSPACASWDMFKSYEQRGDIFKEIVRNLKE